MANCFTPILFVHGQRDLFIAPNHSQDLFNATKGPKEIVLDPGTHSDIRSLPVRPPGGVTPGGSPSGGHPKGPRRARSTRAPTPTCAPSRCIR
eukprot:57168-Prorocentrum_minimum.AAC.1